MSDSPLASDPDLKSEERSHISSLKKEHHTYDAPHESSHHTVEDELPKPDLEESHDQEHIKHDDKETTETLSVEEKHSEVHLHEEKDVGVAEQMGSLVPQDEPPKTAKAEKDGSEVKRPLNAFFVYCKFARPTLRAENPDKSSAEVPSIGVVCCTHGADG